MKTYVVIVRTNSTQSQRIVNVAGFSKFSDSFHYNTYDGTCQYAFFNRSSKTTLDAEIKKALGGAYQPNLNFSEQYDPQWHIFDKTVISKS